MPALALAPTIAIGVSEVATRHNDAGFTDSPDEPYRGGRKLHLDVGLKIGPDLALNLHGGVSTKATQSTSYFSGPEIYDPVVSIPFHFKPYELGIGVTATTHRVWFAPWIGIVAVHVSDLHTYDHVTFSGSTGFGLGCEVGFDVFVQQHHRVAVFVEGTYSKLRSGDEPGPGEGFTTLGASLTQFGVGLAYRYF